MYEYQIEGYKTQGLESVYFWTWRVPYGGVHEDAWSLKFYLTGER